MHRDLSNNQIGEVPSLAFKYLTSLKVLYVASNYGFLVLMSKTVFFYSKLHKNGLKKLQTGSFFVSKLKTYTESKLEELYALVDVVAHSVSESLLFL